MTHSAPSFEDYHDLTTVRSLVVSPDGRRIAFVAEERDAAADELRTAVFVVPADGSDEPRRLSRASDARAAAWSRDGSKLGFVAERETDLGRRVGRAGGARNGDDAGESGENGEGDDEPKPQVWVFDLERGGDARQLTAFDEGAAEFDWAPDGERIVVSTRDPTEDQREYLDARQAGGPVETERLQHKFDGAGWLDDVTSHLFVVDVGSGEARRLDDAYGGGAAEPATGLAPAWSPDGERIAFLSNRTERPDDSLAMHLYTIRPDGAGLERVTDGDLGVSGAIWSPAGRRIAFVAGDPADGYAPPELYVADLDGDVRSVSAPLDRPVGRGRSVGWIDAETLLGVVADEGRSRLARFHADGSPPERVFEGQGDRTIARNYDVFDAFDVRASGSEASNGSGDGTVGLCLSRPDAGPDVYAMALGDVDATAADPDPLVRLTDLNGALLSRYDPPGWGRLTAESDGWEIDCFAYLPADFDADDPDPRPLIVAVHGGPVWHDQPEFDFDALQWTSRGYVVLKPNYRGSSSYGRAFSEAIRGDLGPREAADVLAGIDAVVERGWADPERVFLTGFSYGAITTAYVLARSDRVTAAAAEHGTYDEAAAFGTGDYHNAMEREFGRPWENPEAYRSISGIADVAEMDAPLLLTAGGEDWRCPPTQSEALYVALRKRGVPSKLVVYPGEHHAISAPRRAVHRLETLTAWFERFDPASAEAERG